ncbi:host specificity factor TipJ family phage tail protein [Raoultella terrigena]|uniref:host specificity factor TipJ family phage tail protein n=1 Tax=Raoultella terrigena TaxID=577 RepID=UPI00349F66EB
MAMYEVQRLPGAPKEKGRISAGLPLVRWLDSLKLHNNVVIRLNGRELDDDFDVSYRIMPDDLIQVFDQPKGGSFIKGSAIILGAFTYKSDMKIIGKVLGALVQSPDASASSVATGESSNNDLTGQTNKARLYKGRPNIYGQVRSYPDLIQEALYEYIDDNKYITEWFEVGYGKYTISSVRYSESNLGSLSGASYTPYQPGETIGVMNVGYQFDDIDGEEVPGPNESDDFPAETATSTSIVSGAFIDGQLVIKQLANVDNFAYFADLAFPHSVSFVINVSYAGSGGTVTKDVTGYGDIWSAEQVIDPVDSQVYYNFIIGNLSGGEITSLPADTVINLTKFVLNDMQALVIGPAFSPIEAEQLWVHVQTQLGATAGESSYLIKFWKVDENNNAIPGTAESFAYTLDNDFQVTTKNYRKTYKYTPAAGAGRYAVTIERTNNSNDSNVVTLMAIHAVNVRENVVYPDDTIISVRLKGSNTSNTNREQKYNLLAQRNTITYNTSTGLVDYTLRPSRRFADAVLHEWLVVGGQELSRIDVATLYSIQSSFTDEQLSYFDYTFSDASQSIGERIQTICDAARVNFNYVGDMLTFWRDEAVVTPDAIYARSNMLWDGYGISYAMTLPSGYDGIALDYTDPVTNDKAYIYLSVDQDGIAEVDDATVNAMTVSLLGCRNKPQALDRAYLEARKLLYSRLSMTATVFETTQVVRGAVVQLPDMYDNAQQTGYLTGRNGDIFSTSERIDFGGGDLWVVITDSLGNYHGRWRAYPVDGNNKAFTAAADGFDINIYDGSEVQVASRYFIATDTELNSTIWRVETAKPNGDDTQTLTLSEYSDSIYP